MKKSIAVLVSLAAALAVSAAEKSVSIPQFKADQPGNPGNFVAGSPAAKTAKTGLVTENGKVLLAIPQGQGIRLPKKYEMEAGDILRFEIVMSAPKGSVSIRLGQWSPEGFCGEAFSFVKGPFKPELTKYTGTVTVTNPQKPDANGVMRETSCATVGIHAHNESGSIRVQSFQFSIERKK